MPAATSRRLTTLAAARLGDVRGNLTDTQTAVFAGQTVHGADVLVKYTYDGDANLDGKINVDDYGKIDFNIALGSNGWINGDFNYDGKINVDDYGIIDFNVGIQGPPVSSASTSPSPSPTSISMPAIRWDDFPDRKDTQDAKALPA